MCDPFCPPVTCDPYIPPCGVEYCGPKYLAKYIHASELVKYKTTSTTDNCTGNTKNWVTIYRSNYRNKKSAVTGIFEDKDENNNVRAIGISLDHTVPECNPLYIIITVTVSGYNFIGNPTTNDITDTNVNYNIKSYEVCKDIVPILGTNIIIPFNDDLYKFDFVDNGNIEPPYATAEITIDWYNNRC